MCYSLVGEIISFEDFRLAYLVKIFSYLLAHQEKSNLNYGNEIY